MRFYIDTAIWMDVYEDREGYNKEPLGKFALNLFSLIKTKKYKIVISDLLIKELENNYSIAEINGMMNPFDIEKIVANKEQRNEAKELAKKRNLPSADALHAVLARDNNLVLITRDKHFKKLGDICNSFMPEEVIQVF